MNDETAKTARLINVAEAAVEEFERQGVAEAMSNLRFDPMALARAVIMQRTAMSLTRWMMIKLQLSARASPAWCKRLEVRLVD